MAQTDLQEWLDDITAYLPAGDGWVCIDSTPDDGTGSGTPACDGIGSMFAVKIWWDDERDGAAPTEPLFATSFQP
jgi:type IV pilus assembly protein PilV